MVSARSMCPRGDIETKRGGGVEPRGGLRACQANFVPGLRRAEFARSRMEALNYSKQRQQTQTRGLEDVCGRAHNTVNRISSAGEEKRERETGSRYSTHTLQHQSVAAALMFGGGAEVDRPCNVRSAVCSVFMPHRVQSLR